MKQLFILEKLDLDRLKTGGTLVFKWSDAEHSVRDILALTKEKPLVGHQTRQHSKTHWVMFLKSPAVGG